MSDLPPPLPTEKEVRALLESARNSHRHWWTGVDKDILDAFPCWELFKVKHDCGSRPWPQPWLNAGGKLYEGRMIAPKDDPIWERISLFGFPHEPFDRHDNMFLRDVERDESNRLKVMPDHVIPKQPPRRRLSADLRALLKGCGYSPRFK